MCGIVAYFGGAGNNLTRILTAMSAIIYRAPDSTGVGFLGDDVNPLQLRKSLGSVANLIPVLLGEPAYPNPAAELFSILAVESTGVSALQLQRRLLAYEEFPLDVFDALSGGKTSHPSFDELVELDAGKARSIEPGFPGSTSLPGEIFIRSRKDLRKLIRHLIESFDLSPLVVQILIRSALGETCRRRQAEGTTDIEPADILAAFDRLFERTILGETGPIPQRPDYDRFPRHPRIQKYLWRRLVKTPIRVPADFDRDGVRCLFRLLDAALLSRLPHDPLLESAVDGTLTGMWPGREAKGTIGWKTLYKAEKAVNVYGRAAGAALAHLWEHVYLPELRADEAPGEKDAGAVPGRTDPICLRFFSSPVISQGRWSIQSAVTVQNAHPFFDERKQRLIALNGKFDTGLEAELREFLQKVAGFSFRSENSSEYVSLLWGYYHRQLVDEKRRCEGITAQVEGGFQEINIGSQAIDYQLYHRVKAKSDVDLDAMAFVQAARQIVRQGGQVAMTGLSLVSRRRIFIAAHNRPIFIVRRLENDDFMVVSDTNAAMGLFPHALIHQRTLDLLQLRKEKKRALEALRETGASKEACRGCESEFDRQEAELLEVFRVEIHPLVGEEIFAQITTGLEGRRLRRRVVITDFDGRPLPDHEPSPAVLRPPAIRDDLYRSYFESHLHEVPDRLAEILNYYIPENSELPEFQVREQLFSRHFGPKLTTLKRIVLVGVGGSYNMAVSARAFIRSLLPDVEILALKPAQVDDLSKTVEADTDLVVLLSWSATTAAMVEFAKSLQDQKCVMVAVTEKSFGDMALFARKSGGVVAVLSGEEVTITGIKSTLCMLFCLMLFIQWLAARKGRHRAAVKQTAKLQRIPDILRRVITDETLAAFSRNLASQSARSHAALVLDALDTVGTGLEVASKLEEMSWTAVGCTLDYQDFRPEALLRDMNENLVVVNATSKARFHEALGLMRALQREKLPFAAVTYPNRELEEMKRFTDNRVVCLPKIDDMLQPFVDLAFYYQFAFHYGLAHGRNAEDFPRNRVKSVTASRSSPWLTSSAAEELRQLEQRNQTAADAGDRTPTLPDESLWERSARSDWEKNHYREMRRLSHWLMRADGLGELVDVPAPAAAAVEKIISTVMANEGEILFIPLDRQASAAARNVVSNLRRLLSCRLRVLQKSFVPAALSNNSLAVLVATEGRVGSPVARMLQRIASPCLWVGPVPPDRLSLTLQPSCGSCIIRDDFHHSRADVIYAALLQLVVRAWSSVQPVKAAPLQAHLLQTGAVIDSLFDDASTREAVARALEANSSYRTAFFIGPPVGTGLLWSEMFKKSGNLILEPLLFGESAHGPIVTVDSRVAAKYVRLQSRDKMIKAHGRENVRRWEEAYLKGIDVDRFLDQPGGHHLNGDIKPFSAEGGWYLPLLRSRYDTGEDNLVIIDATSERYFEGAIDELATYGCRYARMIVVSQAAFRDDPEKKVLYQYPISHLIELPAIGGKNGEDLPVSDVLLPLAMNSLGICAAGAAGA